MVSVSLNCSGGKSDGDAYLAVGEFFSVIAKDYAAARETYWANCDQWQAGGSCFALGRLLLGGRDGANTSRGTGARSPPAPTRATRRRAATSASSRSSARTTRPRSRTSRRPATAAMSRAATSLAAAVRRRSLRMS